MPRLFAAQAGADLPHPFQHIPVTYFCLLCFDAFGLCHQEKPQITHHSNYNGIFFQLSLLFHMHPDNGHNLVSVHHSAVFIHCQKSVCIPVKSQTDIGLLIYDSGHQFFHMCGAAVGIDVAAVRIVMNGNDLCSQFLQRFHGSIIGGALGAVHNDLQIAQIRIDRLYRMINIFFSGICPVLNLAHA